MAEKRIPRPDGDFSAWVNNLAGPLEGFWGHFGFDPDQWDAFKAAVDTWNTDYAAHVTARAAADAAKVAKDEARRTLEALARPMVRMVQTFPQTTNEMRAEFGLTVPTPGPRAAPAPATRPRAFIESNLRLSHTLRFGDETTPTRSAKPKGAVGAEVYLALTESATPPSPGADGYRYLGLNSRGTLVNPFILADAGKTAAYCLRWVTATGETGPWSETVTATVAA